MTTAVNDASTYGRAARRLDIAVLLVAVGLGSFAAWRAFPTWDDGALWLSGLEGGREGLASWQSDRPVLGVITRILADHNLLWTGGALLYLVTWVLTGMVTMLMWRHFFPAWEQYGSVAALLAVSPVLVETQAIAINPIFSAHFGVAAVYLGQCLFWAGRRGTRPVAAALAGATIFGASVVSEYAPLAAVIVAGAFYSLEAWAEKDVVAGSVPRHAGGGRRARRWSLAVMIGCAVLGYVVLHSMASADSRPEVRPERQMAALGWRHFLLEVPLRLPFTLWTGLAGELLKDLGEANLSRATTWGVPCGLVTSVIIVWGLRHRRGGAVSAGASASEVPAGRAALALFLPMAVGVAVVIAMTSSIRGNVASRLWLPMLPMASCLSLFIVLNAVRTRFHVTVAALCAFTAGYLEGNAAQGAHHSAKQMLALGEKLHAQLAPAGLTVAMFTNFPTNHAVGDPVPRPYELIAHLTRGWSTADRARFWAGAFPWQPIHESLPGLGGVCGSVRRVDSNSGRGWQRRGAVARVVWVSFDADGVSYIERRDTELAHLP